VVTSLRPFQPQDLDALYAISLATGEAGGDASHLHDDPRLIGHIYSAPYALLAPDLAFVAADEAGVVGYVVGALDTAAWESRLEREWWPALRERHADPSVATRETWTRDEWRMASIHHPRPTPGVLAQAYPAHIHLNLLPRAQRRGLGTALLGHWLAIATARGVVGAHVGVSGANAGGLRFWASQGFEPLSLAGLRPGRTVWMGRQASRYSAANPNP
jgi:GNAT superfamily N-acetyltransferase